MNSFAKIRLLLALIFVSLLLTAIVVSHTYSSRDSLQKTARLLEGRLHKKEALVNRLFSDGRFDQLKKLPQHEHESIQLIENLTIGNRIWLVTYKNNIPFFWTGIKVISDNPEQLKEGSSFLRTSNGYYETIKKTQGNFTAIAYILISSDFLVQNQYLQNKFDPGLLTDNTIDIADISDKKVAHIHTVSKQYLFSIDLKKDVPNKVSGTELVLWVLGLLSLCLLINNTCNYLVLKNKIFLSFALLAVSIIIIRFVNLYFLFPHFYSVFKAFDPTLYSLNRVFPTFGDFCLNIIFTCWFCLFIYHWRNKIIKQPLISTAAYITFILGLILLVAVSTGFLFLFDNLVKHTAINFNVNNILNLSVYSLLGVLMVCFSYFIFFLLIDVFLAMSKQLLINDRIKLAIFAVVILLTTVLYSIEHEFSLFYILWGSHVLVRAYNIKHERGHLSALSYALIILICSIIAAAKLSGFESYKEHEVRKQLIAQLENGDDTNIKNVFKTVEKQIVRDPFLISYFKDTSRNAGYLKNRLQKLYFDGYLADYDFKVHEYNNQDKALVSANDYALSDFKDMVLYSSVKVSDHFYSENDAFGFQSYFAIIPVYEKDKNLGTVIIEVKSKPVHTGGAFPQLLVDRQFTYSNAFKDYSYAFYSDGHLLSQNGSFNYNVVNNEFKGQLKKHVFINTVDNSRVKAWYQRLGSFSHLVYQPSPRKIIVVTQYQNKWVDNVASLTFFFIALLLFSAIILGFSWVWNRIRLVRIAGNNIHWDLGFNFDRILYKTRIQFSMIFAVVVTLTLVGVITFLSIRAQYQEQQEQEISDKVTRAASKFEISYSSNALIPNEANQVEFNNFADAFSSDLTLFSLDGKELFTTQPKIYNYNLLIPRMNARAYIYMRRMQKSVIVNDEKIGELNYKAAYAPIRNAKNATVAFMQLPYFANETDYRERIGAFLNAMINIYALIFMAIGLFAVIVARQITAPLSFIRYNLSKTIYGKKNEPIAWKHNDEIGALVKEYNNMIAALENSAHRLAQSERESAWREMAKQVAHEIKNPLTPLKLGLQLLEKSWRDKDPKFDIKFERFNKSFVEQIESLSSIASEFSAFAKMPDTKMTQLNLFEILGQAVTIFKHMDNVTINFTMPQDEFVIQADRDQLLRCFNNLLKNAIEAMPDDRPGLIDITYTINRNSLLLNIKDNGNGIPETLRDRIFEPNFTTKSSGTGLGLAFVKNSIENAGGKVWFETATGEGTNFFLNFPSAKA